MRLQFQLTENQAAADLLTQVSTVGITGKSMKIKYTLHRTKGLSALTLMAIAFQPLSAAASEANNTDDQGKSNISITSSAALTSDYIWRGLTQTFGKPALQVGVEMQHESGAYLGAWGSNVTERWIPGANLEADVYGGFRVSVPAVQDLGLDLGLIYVYYPGGDYAKALDGKTFKGSSPNTLEAYAAATYKSVSLKYGRTLTKFFGWNENNSAPGVFSATATSAGVTGSTRGSHYVEINVNHELGDGWGANGQFGHQWIAHSTGLDWSYYRIGVTKSLPANWSVGLAYSRTNEPKAFDNYASLTGNGDAINAARPRLLVSVSRQF